MATESEFKTWTINTIKDAMRATGSHWFDPDTMRFFKTRVSDKVYQGQGGVYFVTSEEDPSEERAYSVRKFDPATAEIDTIGDFHSLDRSQAHREARRLAAAGGELIVNREEYQRVGPREQFLADLQTHGCSKATPSHVKRLMTLAREHHAMMEDACNGAEIYDANGDPLPALDSIQTRLEQIVREIGVAAVVFGGDPRGCTVKLTFADGATNDFGGEGWCVPRA